MLLPLVAAGCTAFRGADPAAHAPIPPGEPAPEPGPFAPASIRIYPLTHLGLSREGVPQLVLHIEFTDQWRDTVKAVGVLRVGLSRPPGVADRPPAAEVAELNWEIDLRDPAVSTRYYDRATRTYRITLTGLPPWVEQVAAAPTSGPDTGQRVAVTAAFETPTPDGHLRILRDTYIIRR